MPVVILVSLSPLVYVFSCFHIYCLSKNGLSTYPTSYGEFSAELPRFLQEIPRFLQEMSANPKGLDCCACSLLRFPSPAKLSVHLTFHFLWFLTFLHPLAPYKGKSHTFFFDFLTDTTSSCVANIYKSLKSLLK